MWLSYGLLLSGALVFLLVLFLFLKWDAYNLILFRLGIQTKRQKELQDKIYKIKGEEGSTSVTSLTSSGKATLEGAKPQFAEVIHSNDAQLKDNRLDIIARGEDNIDEATLFEGAFANDEDSGDLSSDKVDERARVYVESGSKRSGSRVGEVEVSAPVVGEISEVKDEKREIKKNRLSDIRGIVSDAVEHTYSDYTEVLLEESKESEIGVSSGEFTGGELTTVLSESELTNSELTENEFTTVLTESELTESEFTTVLTESDSEDTDGEMAFTELTSDVMRNYLMYGDNVTDEDIDREVEESLQEVKNIVRGVRRIAKEVSNEASKGRITEVTEFFVDDEATEIEDENEGIFEIDGLIFGDSSSHDSEATEYLGETNFLEDDDESTGQLDLSERKLYNEFNEILVRREVMNTSLSENIKGVI